jgi:hypothetical protein
VSSAISRIRAITITDFRIRIRRSSTAVIFLLLCIAAYLWIPDPSTGRTLLQMKGQRALYNSPALAMGTAALCSILLGMVGYYLVSNSIGRDTRTRTGFVIASTSVKNYEYLTGIFLGNVLFLSAVIFGFMFSCIIMQLVRGEAPVQITSFLWHYMILLPPMVIFVSAVAVLFESVRWLSGRFGDVCYFFVWIFILAFVGVSAEKLGGKNWTSYFDTFSFAFMLDQVKEITHSDAISIGSTDYNMSKPPFIFPGLSMASSWIGPRIISTSYPLVFVGVALIFFNRFNPLKVKSSQLGSRTSILSRANSLIRPLTGPFFSIARISPKPGLMNAVLSEILMTLQLYPLMFFFLILFVLLSLFSGMESLQQKVLPALFVALAMILADLPTRERRGGTTAMIESMPFLKPHFILWKLGTAFSICLLFNAIPLIRMLSHSPSSAISLVIGSLLIASSAVALGVATGNPKTYMVTFLMFLYLVMNDSGKSPGLDFAGWFGIATPDIQVVYLLIVAILILFSTVVYFRQQKTR